MLNIWAEYWKKGRNGKEIHERVREVRVFLRSVGGHLMRNSDMLQKSKEEVMQRLYNYINICNRT